MLTTKLIISTQPTCATMSPSHVPTYIIASPLEARSSHFANVRPPHETTFALVSAAHAPE